MKNKGTNPNAFSIIQLTKLCEHECKTKYTRLLY